MQYRTQGTHEVAVPDRVRRSDVVDSAGARVSYYPLHRANEIAAIHPGHPLPATYKGPTGEPVHGPRKLRKRASVAGQDYSKPENNQPRQIADRLCAGLPGLRNLSKEVRSGTRRLVQDLVATVTVMANGRGTDESLIAPRPVSYG